MVDTVFSVTAAVNSSAVVTFAVVPSAASAAAGSSVRHSAHDRRRDKSFFSCRLHRFYCFAGKGQPGLSMGAKKRRILSMVTPCSKTSLVVVCINFWTAKKG